jgi:LppX_LprAFG lipoprotein
MVAVGLATLIAGACSASASTGRKVDATALLAEAKATVDAAHSAHFTLTSQGVGGSGTVITGGEGDLVRPDGLQGSFTVSLDGFEASVKVVSKGGVFEAQLPFQTHYVRTNPADYGLQDPSQLLDPAHGLSNLLVTGTDAHMTGEERLEGELLYEVASTVPGSSIPVLPDASPSQPVTLVTAINPTSHQVRQMALTGPFTSPASDSTFRVTLTDYNEAVTITLPPT